MAPLSEEMIERQVPRSHRSTKDAQRTSLLFPPCDVRVGEEGWRERKEEDG